MSRLVLDRGWEYPVFDRDLPYFDRSSQPIVAAINVAAAHWVEIVGPLMWAALIVGWVVAEFFPDLPL